MSSPDRATVKIPGGVVVSCPLIGFKVRRLSACPACPKFGGLEDGYPNGDAIAFHRRYILKCFGAPVKRSLHELEEG